MNWIITWICCFSLHFISSWIEFWFVNKEPVEISRYSFRVPVLLWSLRFLVRVFTFLSLNLWFSYFSTFLSSWSICNYRLISLLYSLTIYWLFNILWEIFRFFEASSARLAFFKIFVYCVRSGYLLVGLSVHSSKISTPINRESQHQWKTNIWKY